MDPILFPAAPARQPRRRPDDQTGDLFALPATKSSTSKAAARAADPAHVAAHRERVRLIVECAGAAGLARFEVAREMRVEQSDVSSSVDALIKAGAIVELTDRKVFNERTNRNCGVLVAARYVKHEGRE